MSFTRVQLRRAIKRAEHNVAQITKARKAGDEKKAAFYTKKYLQSYESRVAAVVSARRRLPWHRRPALKNVGAIAERLNAWSGTSEPAKVLLIKKDDSGNFRRVVDFEIENRSLQYLVAPLVDATCEIHPMQFGTKGVPVAIDAVCELMKDGYLWTVETDITDCFPSFEGENLHGILHLPKKVISQVIVGENLNMVPGDTLLNMFGAADGEDGDPIAIAFHLAEARRGIPHGSAPASRIAEVLIAPVLKSLPEEARVPSYADNLLTMARSEKESESVTQALWSALKAHPVGHLKPKKVNCSKPGEAVHYLGHRLSLIDGKVLITPSPENDAEFESEVKRGLARLMKPAPTAVRKGRAYDLKIYIISWTASYSRCLGIQGRRDYWLGKVEAALGCS